MRLSGNKALVAGDIMAFEARHFFLIFLTLGVSAAAIAALFLTQPVFPMSSLKETGSLKSDPVLLQQHVKKLSEDFVPRNSEHPENLRAVAAYIEKEFSQHTTKVEKQVFTVAGEEYSNVIVRFGPEEGERLVIGAHYDAYSELPGADDNASGIAGTLELARLFSKETPRYGVELVAYTLEEPPYFTTDHMGSVHHARSLKERGIPIRGMISLEMIGYFSDEPGSQAYPMPILSLLYPSQGDFIAVVGNIPSIGLVRSIKKVIRESTAMPIQSMTGPATLPGASLSDQRSYWALGYPAAMITDTAFLRNLNYHTQEDTWEKLDYRRMAEVVDGVFAFTQSE